MFEPEPCPLCDASAPHFEAGHRSMARVYHHCGRCDAIFVARALLPDRKLEEERYRQHRNDDTPEYRAFLGRLVSELIPRLPVESRGLDYGAGPGPVLASMLSEAGFETRPFDPIFHPDESLLRRQYDFVTCTESAEHFHRPQQEFDRMARLLRPGAWLGIMTQTLPDWSDFPQWYYPRDPTHVCFYSAKTFQWIGEDRHWKVELPRPHVALFQRRP